MVLTSFDGSLAGADIMELAALKTREEAEKKCLRGHEVLSQIANMSKPVVAAVDGPVLGGGAEISMSCHARVVGPQLMLGQPEVNLGIIPGYGGTQRLPRLIGLERGLELLRTGRPVRRQAGLRMGLGDGRAFFRDVVSAAKDAHSRRIIEGKVKLAPVESGALAVPEELSRNWISGIIRWPLTPFSWMSSETASPSPYRMD